MMEAWKEALGGSRVFPFAFAKLFVIVTKKKNDSPAEDTVTWYQAPGIG